MEEDILNKVIQVNYEDEMKKSYIDYAMSVITDRALPDVRDGLKPVHRRTLYAMKELGVFPDKPYKKSARIVGDALGKFHPHSDTSVYDAMVRLAQDFNMRMPLVDGHGNFGSIDGDSPAAMRYTEAKLAPIAMEMLQDLEKNVVDFRPNFDNSLKEPTVLPAKFPNLLVNGATGIAVGMSTNIPPHNLNEVIDASVFLLNKPDATIKELMKYIKGPDFPTGGIISNKDDLIKIYKTGKGKIKIRAKLEVEDAGYGKKNIIITEIPYTLTGNKTNLIESIIELIANGKLREATEIRDESSKEGMRIVIGTKKGIDTDKFINKLYTVTKLEDSFPVNLLAICNNSPKTFNLKEMLEKYLEFLKEINIRKINHELSKDKNRKEILEGLIKAADIIDLIIEIIRNSKDISMVKNCLINGKTEGINFKTKKSEKEARKLLFTEKQANAILSLQLQKLVSLEIEKLNKEYNEINKRIEYYNKLINDENELKKYMESDLKRIKKTYKTKRKTVIDNIKLSEMKEELTEENIYILIDRFGYLKVIDEQNYSKINEKMLSEYRKIIKAKNTDNLCIFTDNGDFHQIKISEIPVGKIKDKGIPIDNLYSLKENKILKIIPSGKLIHEVIFITLNGLVKRTNLSEFKTNRKAISATKINKEDKLIGVEKLTEEDKEIVLETEKKKKLRFLINKIPLQKRNAKGVTGINLDKGDFIKKYEITPETNKAKRKRGIKGKADES